MKDSTVKTLQASLLKEAFKLAIEEQQRLIVKKQNAIDNGFDRITIAAVVPYKDGQLKEEIAEHKGYISFYSAMYLHAEDTKTAISEEKIYAFFKSHIKHHEKAKKAMNRKPKVVNPKNKKEEV